jgi:hypothetical protein
MFDTRGMAFFPDLEQHLGVLRSVVGADVEAVEIPARVVGVCDADVKRIISEATAAMEAIGSLRIAASGVLSARSRREQGHEGLSAIEGHRNAQSFVQELTGSTRAEAAKQVRLGESLLDGANLLGGTGAAGDAGGETDAAGEDPVGDTVPPVPAREPWHVPPVPAREPWHAPLGRAQLTGAVTASQHEAILRALGNPPVTGDPAVDAEFAEAWSLAAEQLAGEARERTVDELRVTARTIRDRLDPQGAEQRFLARFEGRSFKLWTDPDGVTHAKVVFDDEMAAWVRTIIDTALRPRRNGPRFVDPEEKARAKELHDDPRTNDQLTYDLIFDTLRAGSLADAKTVFGTRQAGVRVVVTADDFDRTQAGEPAVAHTEDGIVALPAWIAGKRVCESGTRVLWVDGNGEPLRLGREERTFTGPQRVALAIRDGGCRWRDCDRPASMCEAHHIDPYSQGGHTDVDRGILLCRFHHMQLHHGSWRISRHGHGDFILHPPPDTAAGTGTGEPLVLAPRLALTYAWAGIDPPPQRFHPRVA